MASNVNQTAESTSSDSHMPSMKHSMSYRKPVPLYIPSPLPSPVPLPVVLPGEGTPVDCSRQEHGLPPLPQNWRQIVHTRVSEAKSSQVSLATPIIIYHEGVAEVFPAGLHKEARASRSQSVIFSKEEPPSAKRPNTLKKTPGAYRHTLRGLPTSYRPPTPPSQSHSIHRITLESPTSSSTSSHEHDHERTTRTTKVKTIYQPADLPSLRPTPSFRTDRTMISGPISGHWSHSLGTLALTDGDTNHYSTPWKKQVVDVDWSVSDYPGPDTDNDACCCFGGVFSRLFSGICRK